MTQETAQEKVNDPQEGAIVPISDETRALVEKKMPHESAEVQQKFGELIEAIKRQAQREMESAEEISRDVYVGALEKAQLTMKQAQGFFHDQEKTLEGNLKQVKDSATQTWDTLVADIKSMGNRVDRAIETAWTILTEPDDPKA